jgi:eukaryotic-like serine/threonine-protein kinase
MTWVGPDRMDNTLRRRIHQVLQSAFDFDEADRVQYVLNACASDERLAGCKPQLLAAIGVNNTFLEVPALSGLTRPADPAAPREVPGRIGNYQILGRIGSGGMGTVFEAIQDQPRRKVALKIPHITDGRAARPRMQYESEVLARLRHPAIAQIYEAGFRHAENGESFPWFAMEFVPDARTLSQYATEHPLSLREKLELFCTVCSAVQHGHRIGVIHRDLKPANILVDGEGNPKVIDFGIARSNLPDEESRFGDRKAGRLFGTLNYMSPEQFDPAGETDARTDVYSLGVVLYELLCGELPFQLSGLPIHEARDRIATGPPRPPCEANPKIETDLQAIVLKAIARHPDDRYRTADALETDIRHFIEHFPVDARPASLGHQARLLARRNPRFVMASGVALLAVMAGAGISTYFGYQMWRESKKRFEAEKQAIEKRDEAIWQTYVANISGGFAALRSREFRQMRDRLAASPVQHRGWEWNLLHGLAELSETTIPAHDDMIYDLAVSPDNRFLVTGSRDGVVQVRETGSLDLRYSVNVAEFVGQTTLSARQVHSVDVTRDGQRMIAGLGTGEILIHDLETGRHLGRFRCTDGRISNVCCGPDDLLVTTSPDEGERIWSVREIEHYWAQKAQSGEVPTTAPEGQRLLHEQGRITGAKYSNDGQFLVTWDREGNCWLRNGTNGEVIRKWSVPEDNPVAQVAISPDSRYVAAGCGEAKVLIWAADSDQAAREFVMPGTRSTISSITFSADGQVLLTGRVDRGITLMNVEDGAWAGTLNGHEEAVSGLWMDPSADRLLSSGWDRTLRVWNLSGETQLGNISILKGHEDHVLAGTWSNGGATIITGSQDGTVRFWDPARRCLLATEPVAGSEGVRSLALSPTNPLIAVGTESGNVGLIDSQTGNHIDSIASPDDCIWTLAFSPDGKRLASAGDQRKVVIRDVATRESRKELVGHTGRIIQLAWSPDGKKLATASRDQTARIWDAESGKCLHVLSGHEADVFAILFSGDGKRLYTGSRDQSVRVWDVASGRQEKVISGEGQFITCLAMSPDGKRLAAGSWFGEIVLWDLACHQVVTTFKGHEQAIRDIEFSPDGTRLLTVSYDRLVRIHDSRPTRGRNEESIHANRVFKESCVWLDQFWTSESAAVSETGEVFTDPALEAMKSMEADRQAAIRNALVYRRAQAREQRK